jgi:hypothetical protein
MGLWGSNWGFNWDSPDTAVEAADERPVVMLKTTRDGGHTWQPEVTASLGKLGEYGKRVVFRQLGAGPLTGMELTISDAVKVAIGGAYARVERLEI